ncbi:hypothetical protein [Sporosarcina sp.]|uniref:hypothetical protein n=1 Tax=Sporosarcina sp. TaxID=49982 RepID=UPI00262405D5|nr:hypothetical protein [Sporosarcina sp.]
MPAYMVNEYYIFTSYDELSSLIHDIVHYSILPTQRDSHQFSIQTGELDTHNLQFKADGGHSITVRYESEEDLYYCVQLNELSRVI